MTLDEFIIKSLSIKFRDKGRDYSNGDCWAIPYLAYRDILGVELPNFIDEYPDAGDTKSSRRIIGDIAVSEKQNWEQVKTPKPLDIVLFRFGDTNTHVGLAIDEKRFIHCEKKINTVIERLDSVKWQKRTEGIYRLKRKNG
jgi:cell wall-associated NlpC family hydrolase